MMSLQRVREYLQKYGLDHNIMEFTSSSKTVREAAQVLQCSEQEIAKTLSFMVDEQPIVIVTAGDQKIDNAKYKAYFHVKAKMIPRDQVEKIIGHEVGGVCPFGVNPEVMIYLDVSLKRLASVYPACGSHNSAIRLTIEKLEQVTNYPVWVDVCKKIEVEL